MASKIEWAVARAIVEVQTNGEHGSCKMIALCEARAAIREYNKAIGLKSLKARLAKAEKVIKIAEKHHHAMRNLDDLSDDKCELCDALNSYGELK